MNKKQKIITQLNKMKVGRVFSYTDFPYISQSYFNSIMRKLSGYVSISGGGYGHGQGRNASTTFILVKGNIPMPKIERNYPKHRNAEKMYTNRFTVMLDDELDKKIKNLPEGERSEFVRDAIKNHFNQFGP